MRRDRRLLGAMALFGTSFIAALVQAWIVNLYIQAAVLGGWDQFAAFFGVTAPSSGPDKFCFDYCAPELPFIAGWIAIGAFLSGFFSLICIWWKPAK